MIEEPSGQIMRTFKVRLSTVFLLSLFVLGIGLSIFSYRTSRGFLMRRTEALRAAIAPGMTWHDLARMLEMDRRWGLMTFGGDQDSCGGLRPVGNGFFEFGPPMPKDGGPLPSARTISTLSDPMVVGQFRDCTQVQIHLYVGSFKKASFELAVDVNGIVKGVGAARHDD